jgi:hypothetical protein
MESPRNNTEITKILMPLVSDGAPAGQLSFEDGPIEETPHVLGTEPYGREDHMKTGWKEGRGATLRLTMLDVIDSESIPQ